MKKQTLVGRFTKWLGSNGYYTNEGMQGKWQVTVTKNTFFVGKVPLLKKKKSKLTDTT